MDLLQSAEYALSSIHPDSVLRGLIDVVRGECIRITHPVTGRHSRFPFRRLHFLAMGKAAPWMAGSCGHMIDYADTAVLVSQDGTAGHIHGWKWLYGDHPIPSWWSLSAGKYVRRMLMDICRGDLIIVLLSGGASSMVSLPTRDSSLLSIATKTRELMYRGANIHELNAFRRSVDQLKSGGLSRLVSPAHTITLMVSDVPGDIMEDIGSGPTIPDHVHVSDTENMRYGKDRWSYPYPAHIIITRNVDARTYCIDFLKSRGFSVQTADVRLSGEARKAGTYIAEYARKIKASSDMKCTCIVYGGETTVTVGGQGRGGRNLELAASFAASVSGTDGIHLLTLSTDGKDGSSPSCGALVNGSTLSSGGFSREDAERYLDDNDSYSLLSACGSTIYSGPTGTNVMDIAILALC